MTIQSVLCAVDFSPESPGVLRAAMAVAEREHATLDGLARARSAAGAGGAHRIRAGPAGDVHRQGPAGADRAGGRGPPRRSGRGAAAPAHRRAGSGNSRAGCGKSRNAARDRHARLQRRAPDVLRLDRRPGHQQGDDAGAGDSAPRAASRRVASAAPSADACCRPRRWRFIACSSPWISPPSACTRSRKPRRWRRDGISR